MKLHVTPHFLALAGMICSSGLLLTACALGGTPHPSHHGVADSATDPDGRHVASGPYIRTEQVPPVISDVPTGPTGPTNPAPGSPSQPTIPQVKSMVKLLGRPDPAVLHHDICEGVSFAGPHATRDPGGRWVRFAPEDFSDAQLAVRSAVGIGGIDTTGYNIRAWMSGDTQAAMASPACQAGR